MKLKKEIPNFLPALGLKIRVFTPQTFLYQLDRQKNSNITMCSIKNNLNV